MTISSQTRKAGPFVGNDSSTAFPFAFKVFQASDLLVVRQVAATGVESTLALGTDYTVSLNANQNANPGGTVTLAAGALATGYNLTITSSLQYLQPTDITNQGAFYPRVINDALDRLTIFVQQLWDNVGRSIRFPVSDSGYSTTLPAKDQRKGRVLAFHETTGNPVQGPSIAEVGTVAGNIASINTVASNIADVNTVADSIADVGTVASNIADVNTVADDIAKVNTVADNIADVNTLASNIAKVNTVADNIADVNTVADNIADVNAAADNIAAIIDAPNQAAAAANSASAAGASATSAASSAAAAAAALDNFDDRYLGAKASDPTTDNDGNPLVQGALYYNTTTSKMRVYEGTGWIDTSNASIVTMNTFEFVATAGQTTFTGVDANGNTLSYLAPALIVTLNGSMLRPGDDYTATNGTSVVLASAAAASDELVVIAFGNFVVADLDGQDVSFTQAGTGAVGRTVTSKLRESVSVLDFGADPTGATDSTQAFRDACRSTQPLTSATAHRMIKVPAGRYKLTDTVYVRAGDHLMGDGMATYIDASSFISTGTRNVFKTGYGLIDGVETIDNTIVGDLPPEVSHMFVLGGPGAGGAVIDHRFPGGVIHDLWFSAAGTAINLGGAIVYDCMIDGGLSGIVCSAGEATISNVAFFNPNYGITLTNNTRNFVIEGCSFQYCKYEAINVGGTNNNAILISNCNFYWNEQYTTISAGIVLRADNQSVHITSCTFTNMKSYAIHMDSLGSNKKLYLQGCVFNGERSANDYTQSTTAAGISVVNGYVDVQGCQFLGLRGYTVNVGSGSGVAHLNMQSSRIYATDSGVVDHDIHISSTTAGDTVYLSDITGSGLNLFNANTYTYPSARSLQNWLQVKDNGARKYVEIPYRYGVLIDFNLYVNMYPPGDFAYRKNKRMLIDVYREYNGAYTTFLQTSTTIQSPALTFPVLDVVAEIGSIGGGTSTTSLTGKVVVHWPNFYGLETRSINAQLI